MANITYLLGAGASYDSLPVVEEFPAAIQDVEKGLEIVWQNIRQSGITQRIQIFGQVLEDFSFFANGCNNHQSVDTFAKMLFLTDNEEEYRKVKCLIIFFFNVYYYFLKKTDKRYDAFLAAILSKKKPRFPENINVISWNYDFEFERAFLKYSGNTTLEGCCNDLGLMHKHGKIDPLLRQGFKILKINGTAGFWLKNQSISLGLGTQDLCADQSPYDPTRIWPLVQNYYNAVYGTDRGIIPAISFSWETGDEFQRILVHAKKVIAQTRILVVVGYSFPFFNRKVDAELLESTIGLDKIYVQDKEPESVIETIKGFQFHQQTTQFIPIKNLKQFYMPHEL